MMVSWQAHHRKPRRAAIRALARSARGELCPVEDGPGEARRGEVGADCGIQFSPSVPGMDAVLDTGKVLVIRHVRGLGLRVGSSYRRSSPSAPMTRRAGRCPAMASYPFLRGTNG